LKRRHAIPLAILWVIALVGFDVWYVLEMEVAGTYLNRALAEMFEAPVSFADLSVSALGSVVVGDIRVMRPDQPRKVYATIDEVRITPSWIDLVTSLDLVVKDIEVRNPTLVVQWDEADGTFDMPSPLRSDLEARTRTAGELPAIALRGLTLVLENPPDIVRKQQAFQFDQLSIALTPEGSSRWLYRFDADIVHPVLGRLTGGGRFSREAVVVELHRQGLMITPDLLGVVRPELKEILGQLSVDGDVQVTASVGPVEGEDGELFTATLDCRGVNARLADWPQALSGIQGRLEYTRGRVTTEGLTARFEGAPLTLAGFVDFGEGRNAVVLEGNVVGLRIDDRLAARTRRLPEPCPTVADQIEAWNPDGYANVSFRLEQDRGADGVLGPIRPAIDVEFRGGTSLRYIGHVGDDRQRHGFAYPLEDLRGLLRFTDKAVTFERLTAMNGSLSVEARGRIEYERSGDETYDVDVDAHGLKLDDRVAQALAGGSRDLFNSLDAQGSVDVVVGVKRKRGEPPGPRVDVGLDLQGVALRPRQFPLDFVDARGRVTIPDSGAIKIERISARRAGGTVSLQGSVPAHAGRGGLDLDLQFTKFPVDAALTSALGELVPNAAGVLSRLNPAGRIDGSLRIATEKDGLVAGLGGSIAFEDMTLAPEDPSIRIQDLDGSVTLGPTTVTINKGTTASIAGERFAFHGTIQHGTDYDVVVEADGFRLDRELVAEVEPLIPWIRELGPEPHVDGPMSLALHVKGAAPSPSVSADVEFLGVDVAIGEEPRLRLRDVRGRLSLDHDGNAKLTGLSARVPAPGHAETAASAPAEPESSASGAALELASGTWTQRAAADAPSAGSGRLDLVGVSVRGLRIGPETLAILPIGPDAKTKLAALDLRGAIDLSATGVRYQDGVVTASRGRLVVAGLAVGADQAFRADRFTVEKMTFKAGGGAFQLDGDFGARGASVRNIPVPAMIGRVTADVEGVRFDRVEADLFAYDVRDGRRFSLGKVNPEASSVAFRFEDASFDLDLRFHEVNLPAAIRAFGGDPGRVSGTFSSRVALRGVLGEDATYEGSGSLTVRARNVVSLPVFYRLFNSLDILRVFEKTDPWTRIDVDFAAANRILDMRRIRIDAPDVMLEGPGTLSFDGNVRADLKANQGIGVSPIGWVTRLISHVMFAGVRVDGPIGDPRVSAYPIGGR
jgi:hypothetical protein